MVLEILTLPYPNTRFRSAHKIVSIGGDGGNLLPRGTMPFYPCVQQKGFSFVLVCASQLYSATYNGICAFYLSHSRVSSPTLSSHYRGSVRILRDTGSASLTWRVGSHYLRPRRHHFQVPLGPL
ncbi:hypothetical protein OPQ81_008406 [Rhizoctonia solani]|nr:hypothetical protein OPQ81_008406 [Rhizoctonia solani]